MINAINETGRVYKTEEQVWAEVESAFGLIDNYNNPFELIRFKLRGISEIAVMPKGFQNTTIVRNSENKLKVEHGPEGLGSLRLEPNSNRECYGHLARTPWNEQMIIKGFKDSGWDIVDPKIREEFKEKHDKWWKTLDPEEQKEILTRRKYSNMSMHNLPPNFGDRKNIEVEKILAESAVDKVDLKKQDILIKELQHELKNKKQKELDAKIKSPEEKQEITESTGDTEPDYESMKTFSLFGKLKEKGIKYDKKLKKPELIKLLKEG